MSDSNNGRADSNNKVIPFVRETDFYQHAFFVYGPGSLLVLLAALLWYASSVVLLVFSSLLIMLIVLIAVLLNDATGMLQSPRHIARGLDLGIILVAVPAMLIAFLQEPSLALNVVILFAGIQILEGYLLAPLIDQSEECHAI